MKKIKTYNQYINEEVNFKKVATTAALGAGLAFGNPSISQEKPKEQITNVSKKETDVEVPLISFNSFAQNQKDITLVSNKNQVGIYDEDQRVFKWSDVNYAEIQIQFTDNFVRLSNVNESTYQIIKSEGTNSGKTEIGMTWSAIDKKSRKCKISLTKYADGDITFSVLYDDICFRYYIVIPIDIQ